MAHGLAQFGDSQQRLLRQLLLARDGIGVEALCEHLCVSHNAVRQPVIQADSDEALARALANRLDELGYEAVPARHGDDWQVEAFNCVFHGLARQHPQVCKFDLAYMEAATGRRVHHVECIIRGGHACRFKLGPESADSGLVARLTDGVIR